MGASSFNEMELDAIGEIMNISLGASATAVSTMLGTKTNITTPVVRVQTREEFEFKRLEPAIGVEIAYVEGLEGKNIMMFRREDVCVIVGTLMGEDPANISPELDEIHISAICEVMNQMMGASATALSEFLGTIVNISTPTPFDIGEPDDFKTKYFTDESGMVVVRFRLEIEDKLNSEFMNIMSPSLAKRLLAPFEDSMMGETAEAAPAPAPQPAPEPEPAASTSGGTMSQDEINALLGGANQSSAPEPAAPAGGGMMSQDEINALLGGASQSSTPEPAAPASGGMMSQDEINAVLGGVSQSSAPEPAPTPQPVPTPQPAPQPVPQAAPMPQGGQQPFYSYPPMGMDPMMLQLLNQMQQTQMQMMEMMKNTKPSETASGSSTSGGSIIRPLSSTPVQDDSGEGGEDKANQEMLMKVPLEISVEIGRTKRLVKDILEFTQGTLVVLDKMAGEQVDLFVNGQCIARGDIVVVEDNFGIRITEIVAKELNPESL